MCELGVATALRAAWSPRLTAVQVFRVRASACRCLWEADAARCSRRRWTRQAMMAL